jgi:hypothetical protein
MTASRRRLPAAVLGVWLAAGCAPAWAGEVDPRDLERLAGEIARQEEELARQRALLAEQSRRLEEQDRKLEEQRQELARLRARLGGPVPSEERAASAFPRLPGTWRPRGDTQVGPVDRFSLGLGIQYRVMHNASNIPGPGGTTVDRTETYDFFRQRLRLNLSVAPRDVPAGGFLQAEFRGGFGGSSPNASDARDEEPTRNPFNRLQARGIRYGYLYASPFEGPTALAGVLPMSDELGDTLFSADWDFNVGGVALLGARGPASYRLAYLRLIEAVGATDADSIGEDGDLFLADLTWQLAGAVPLDDLRVGGHAYHLIVGEGLPLGDTDETWLGVTVAAADGPWSAKAFAVLNVGHLGIGELDDEGRVVSGFETDDAHTGYALKLETARVLGPATLALQSLYASGDPADDRVHDRFVTPQGLFRTQGYWAYTHLFTANPPSDVNDLGLEIGNRGAGLLTVQGRLGVPLHRRVGLEVAGGWFQGARRRNRSRTLGTEVATMVTFVVAEGMTLDVGGARAFLGDFLAPGADDLFEIFTRLQLQY